MFPGQRKRRRRSLWIEDPERHLHDAHAGLCDPVVGRRDGGSADAEPRDIADGHEIRELLDEVGKDVHGCVELVDVDVVRTEPPQA